MRGELRKIEKPNDIPLGLSMLHRLASLKQVDEAKMPQRLNLFDQFTIFGINQEVGTVRTATELGYLIDELSRLRSLTRCLTVHIVQLCRSQDSGGPVDVFDCHAVRTGFGRRDAVTRFFDSRASDG
jgi:hypothetical protein